MENSVALGGGQRLARLRNQRLAERQVELHRPGRRVLEGAGCRVDGGLDGPLRVAARGDVDGEANVFAEEVQLDGGLVGAGPV